ncbi:MAG: hypothetical protein H6895_11780, partial [Defluviimonas sp.]|nr:hypothetical protein [Defluviimonas sp.]
MTNILAFPARAAATREAERLTALIACFATQRRADGDVFWFKENGELLNILETAAIEVPEGALDLYRPFYETLERRAEFFPQYYRFLLSIALDLEDLGLAGDRAGRLVAWLAQEGAAGAELSDLHRAEARRLMARRGIEALPGDTGLNDRLRAFAERSETFAVPNRKAAYDLT